MDEKELQFDLEDIMKEFGGGPAARPEQPQVSADTVELPTLEQIQSQLQEPQDSAPAEAAQEVTSDTVRIPGAVTSDTVRLPDTGVTDDTVRLPDVSSDTVRLPDVSSDTVRLPDAGVTDDTVRLDAPLQTEPAEPSADPFTTSWEPDYDQPIGDYVPPQPIVFHPRNRLRELKRKLVAGPEKQYYTLSEKGMGKLQLAIFLSLLVTVLAAASTVLYALDMVPANRIKLMIFGQLLAMMFSALLGSFQLIEGLAALGKGRFTLNTLLCFTFLACVADGLYCLREPVSRIPCCAAFSLAMTFSLWSAYQERHARLGQLDTMRKANHLDGICVRPDYFEGRKGLLRKEGQVEEFMDHYQAVGLPEKRVCWYALSALVVCIGIGAYAGVRGGVEQGLQVTAAALLAAVPATAFITISRPHAILVRKLNRLGAVLCGWKSIYRLKGKAVFPLRYEDLFPSGTVKMNGVKFYGSRQPDQIVEYATAVIAADQNGLAPLFNQLLDSRNGRHYDVQQLRSYQGGMGGIVEDEPVLCGSLSFLEEMGVEIPEGIRVAQAVCVAVDGELCGLFALSYDKDRAAAAGLLTLCGYRGLKPVLTAGDFMLTDSFLRSKFGVKPGRVLQPDRQQCRQLEQLEPEPELECQVLVTGEGLAPFAYGVAGARALRTACNVGSIIHLLGGVLGMGIVLTLTLLGALEYISPANMLAYQLVWMIPGLLVTEWTRSL